MGDGDVDGYKKGIQYYRNLNCVYEWLVKICILYFCILYITYME